MQIHTQEEGLSQKYWVIPVRMRGSIPMILLKQVRMLGQLKMVVSGTLRARVHDTSPASIPISRDSSGKEGARRIPTT